MPIWTMPQPRRRGRTQRRTRGTVFSCREERDALHKKCVFISFSCDSSLSTSQSNFFSQGWRTVMVPWQDCRTCRGLQCPLFCSLVRVPSFLCLSAGNTRCFTVFVFVFCFCMCACVYSCFLLCIPLTFPLFLSLVSLSFFFLWLVSVCCCSPSPPPSPISSPLPPSPTFAVL